LLYWEATPEADSRTIAVSKMMLDKCGKVIDIMERINAMFVCRKHKETVKEKNK
jgi:hypothetical protein